MKICSLITYTYFIQTTCLFRLNVGREISTEHCSFKLNEYFWVGTDDVMIVTRLTRATSAVLATVFAAMTTFRPS